MESSVEIEFQQLCHRKQLAATHQRLVVYRALMQAHDHPNPEQLFERVRRELPSISLATIYKTLHLFLEAGIIREVSPHHGSLRIEPNAIRHPHFFCLQCHGITDLASTGVDASALLATVPDGYRIDRVSMEVQGLCRRCAAQAEAAEPDVQSAD